MAFKSIEWKEIDGEKWFRFNSGYDRFRYFWGNILTVILIVLLIVEMIWLGLNIEAIKANPLSYYAIKASKVAGEQLQFTCYQGNDPEKEFHFNSTTIWLPAKNMEDVNFSNLQVKP